MRLNLIFAVSAALMIAPPRTAGAADTVPLSQVIAEVQNALNRYQVERGQGPDALPPLVSAEFDFKTTTSTTFGAAVSLLIFKFGTSHENDAINEVTYTYSVPKPEEVIDMLGPAPLPTLASQLVETIEAAARSVQGSATMGTLKFSQLAVNLQYGVKVDASGSAAPIISFVTVGLSGDKNRNTVQSVKLVFADK